MSLKGKVMNINVRNEDCHFLVYLSHMEAYQWAVNDCSTNDLSQLTHTQVVDNWSTEFRV